MKALPKIPYRYTKKERKQLLKSLVILVDTREQKAEHITNYMKDKGAPYKSKKLDMEITLFFSPGTQRPVL
jgi:hypothetical protein